MNLISLNQNTLNKGGRNQAATIVEEQQESNGEVSNSGRNGATAKVERRQESNSD
jgi:hypothetical protein